MESETFPKPVVFISYVAQQQHILMAPWSCHNDLTQLSSALTKLVNKNRHLSSVYEDLPIPPNENEKS